MGAKKRQDNFSSWRTKRQQKTLAMIKLAIEEAERHKLYFVSESKMIAWVSSRIDVHRTTIERSLIYMHDIKEYYYHQAGAGCLDVNEKVNSELLLSKIKTMKLELSRKENDLKRLYSYIEKHHVDVSIDNKKSINMSENINCERKISDVCMSLLLIQERVSNIILLDKEKREIHDLSVRKNKKIVASGDKVKALFDWLEDNDFLNR